MIKMFMICEAEVSGQIEIKKKEETAEHAESLVDLALGYQRLFYDSYKGLLGMFIVILDIERKTVEYTAAINSVDDAVNDICRDSLNEWIKKEREGGDKRE